MTGIGNVGAQPALPPTTEAGRKIDELICCGRDDSHFQMTIVSILLYLLQQEELREKADLIKQGKE